MVQYYRQEGHLLPQLTDKSKIFVDKSIEVGDSQEECGTMTGECLTYDVKKYALHEWPPDGRQRAQRSMAKTALQKICQKDWHSFIYSVNYLAAR